MKSLISTLFVFSWLLASCHSHENGHSHDDSHGHSHEEPSLKSEPHAHGDEGHTHDHESEPHSHVHDGELEGEGEITLWSESTELFMEYPALLVGQSAVFAVHLTRLSDFAPLDRSTVTFRFRSERGAMVSVTVNEARIPGIYGPEVTFEEAGRYDLTIVIDGMVDDTLHIHGIPVYATADEVPHAHDDEDPDVISFLKEQQWAIPFGTQQVDRMTLFESVEAHGELKPVLGQTATVSAPFAGIVLSSLNQSLPGAGQSIAKDEILIRLNPAIQSADGENYANQFIYAQSQLELARNNLERSRRLFAREAIPEVELEKARIEYRQALTQFETMNEIARIDTSTFDLSGNQEQSYRFELKAPIDGVVTRTYVSPGQQVRAGEPLFSIADMSKLWMEVHVPAFRQSKIGTAESAVVHIQGSDDMYHLEQLQGRLLHVSNEIDPATRTLSLTYEINNPGLRFQSGLFATVEIDSKRKENILAVPVSALIEDEGTYSVFVQLSGESFEKREVVTGIRNREMAEILSGLSEGERVVTVNPYRVKLASMSGEVPAHGHSH